MSFDSSVHLTGWIDDPARHPLTASFARPLAQVAPRLMNYGVADNIFLFKAWKEVLGDYPAYVAQQIGDCFRASEPVRMADGSDRAIAEVQVGDEVITHVGRPRKVTRTIRKPYDGEMIEFGSVGSGWRTASTTDHQFLSGENWVPADALTEYSPLWHAKPGQPLESASLWNRRRYHFAGDVHCIEVEEDHSFLAGGYAAHNCTSFGSGHAVDLLQCVEIVAGEPSEFKEVCTEAIYGMGREIAGMLGGGDGCYGAAVSKALVTMGAVTREMVGAYSGRRAKEWGARGVPADVKKQAEPYKVGASALITTLEELDASLDSGYPSAGGFSQGFVMKRDQDGLCLQSGRWGHEQCCIGRRKRGDRRQYLLGQSWGPNVPDGPLTDDQPNFSFWIWDTHMLDILKQRDWFTFSKAPDFVRRPLPAAWTTKDFI